MREIKLKEGGYIRVRGNVTIYSPHKKSSRGWIGGSSWTLKNPLIRLGKCKHKPRNITWIKDQFSNKRIYTKGRVECEKCGYIIKFGKQEFLEVKNDKKIIKRS